MPFGKGSGSRIRLFSLLLMLPAGALLSVLGRSQWHQAIDALLQFAFLIFVRGNVLRGDLKGNPNCNDMVRQTNWFQRIAN